MELMDYCLTISYPELPVKQKTVINAINRHSYSIAKSDVLFRMALIESDILLPDGTGFNLQSTLPNERPIPRITCSDIHTHLLVEANRLGLKVFYLGESDGKLDKKVNRIKKNYPNIKVRCYCPPSKDKLSIEDNRKIFSEIRRFGPYILFVGMGVPRQEKWVFRYKNKVNAMIIASVGAGFEFYSGAIKGSGGFWPKLGLDWLAKLAVEPRKILYKTVVSTPLYLKELVWNKLKN